jgi:hypothetical protein
MRRAHRTDGSHAEIVEHLTAIGATVQSLAGIGGGCPDLLVGHQGVNLLVEEKDGEKAQSQRDLTEYQERWVKRWKGMPVIVATSGREAVRLVCAAVDGPNNAVRVK